MHCEKCHRNYFYLTFVIPKCKRISATAFKRNRFSAQSTSEAIYKPMSHLTAIFYSFIQYYALINGNALATNLYVIPVSLTAIE